MRNIAAQLLHDANLLRIGPWGLPAPDAPAQILRSVCPRMLDCSVTAACSHSIDDVSQRRAVHLAATDQRLSHSHPPHARPTAATEGCHGHASWLDGPAHGSRQQQQQHQQQRNIRLFEVLHLHAGVSAVCMVNCSGRQAHACIALLQVVSVVSKTVFVQQRQRGCFRYASATRDQTEPFCQSNPAISTSRPLVFARNSHINMAEEVSGTQVPVDTTVKLSTHSSSWMHCSNGLLLMPILLCHVRVRR